MASSLTVRTRLNVASLKNVVAAFEGVKDGVRNRVLKQSIGKVARRTAKEAKRLAPRGPSGTLRRSMGTRYKSYRRGLVWVYVIGARRGIVGHATHQPKRGEFVASYYAHLAERGRQALTPGLRTSGGARGKGKSKPSGKNLLLFYPTPVATTRVAATRVRAARGTRFMARTYRMLDSPSARLTRVVSEDIIAGIEREAAKYGARGKSIYK